MYVQGDLLGTIKGCSLCQRKFLATAERQELCGHCLKAAGMEAAVDNQSRRAMLRAMRKEAIVAGRWRDISIEDVYPGVCRKYGMSLRDATDVLGNAAGSVFKGGEWEYTGRRVVSKMNRNNHAKDLNVWRQVQA